MLCKSCYLHAKFLIIIEPQWLKPEEPQTGHSYEISDLYFVNGEWEEKRRGNVKKRDQDKVSSSDPSVVDVVHSSLRIIIHSLAYNKSKFSQ